MKYIIVTGGVLSGLGKGITTSSIGVLLRSRGVKVTAVKIDPYVNIDAGTMNPFEHGEVFVLKDGGEVDQDLGNYERFLDLSMARDNNITTGKVYKTVIDRERRGDYLGKTVQIIPHVTNEIRERVKRVASESDADVCLVEVGGTVGDIESAPFLEALRELHLEEGHPNVAFVHTTLVPVVGAVGEQKTKPTQHSIMELRRVGLDADVLVCRSEGPLDEKTKAKLANFANLSPDHVISAPDAKSIYEVPLIFEEQGVGDLLIDRLGLRTSGRNLREWRAFVDRVLNPAHEVTIAVVGKYVDLADSYLSIREAFMHAGAALNARVKIRWVDSEALETPTANVAEALTGVHGILVAPGFGPRGTEGKIKAVQFVREHKIPFLGICFGFQLATIEFARNVCGLRGANSTELNPGTSHPVIMILPEQQTIIDKGGTMRLGESVIKIEPGTQAAALYGAAQITERHRHRYEVNPEYIDTIQKAGLKFSGRNPDKPLMEVLELPGHPFFMGGQFHPEFKSRPTKPAPLFRGLVEAALKRAVSLESPTRSTHA